MLENFNFDKNYLTFKQDLFIPRKSELNKILGNDEIDYDTKQINACVKTSEIIAFHENYNHYLEKEGFTLLTKDTEISSTSIVYEDFKKAIKSFNPFFVPFDCEIMFEKIEDGYFARTYYYKCTIDLSKIILFQETIIDNKKLLLLTLEGNLELVVNNKTFENLSNELKKNNAVFKCRIS